MRQMALPWRRELHLQSWSTMARPLPQRWVLQDSCHHAVFASWHACLQPHLPLLLSSSRLHSPKLIRVRHALVLPAASMATCAAGMQVLAGALQDNRRATIVGETTFGKGLIQTIVELSDGSAVVITAARYRVRLLLHQHLLLALAAAACHQARLFPCLVSWQHSGSALVHACPARITAACTAQCF